MFVFNFGVESLEQSVKLDRLVILISLAISFSKHHFFQIDNQKAVLFTVFSLLELFFSYCIVVAVANFRAKLWDWGARRFVRHANINLQRSQSPVSEASNFWQNKLFCFQILTI